MVRRLGRPRSRRGRTTFRDGTTQERTDRNEYAIIKESGAWKIGSNTQPESASDQPADGSDPVRPGGSRTSAAASSTSSNWSGYVATGGSFTSVTGTWTVPQVSATATGADAAWVGIGGASSDDLIQAGTMAHVDGSGGVEYAAWIETLPQPAQPVSLSVTAGDSVTVTLSEQSDDRWSIVMTNNTRRTSYSTTVSYASSESSAEWIQEAPSSGRGQVPLDNFGTVYFSGGSADRDGRTMTLAALGARPMAMINAAGQAVAVPSVLDQDGRGFAVTRTDAPSTTTGGSRRFRR